MIQSWENLVTDGRQTNESDFIGRCPNNVEHQKKKLSTLYSTTTEINTCLIYFVEHFSGANFKVLYT